MSEPCGAETVDGEPCRAWPMQGSQRCVAHQDAEPDETEDDAGGQGRCRAPTQRGGLCKKVPMQGAERCHLHIDGLDPTEAEQQARREANMRHAYFVSGFLDEDERELFQRVLEGQTDIGRLRRNVIAALTVRADRMMRWEAEGQQISGFATEVFGELRKTIEAIEPDELEVQHSWDIDEVRQQVRAVIGEDPTLLVRLIPPEAREAVRQELAEEA